MPEGAIGRFAAYCHERWSCGQAERWVGLNEHILKILLMGMELMDLGLLIASSADESFLDAFCGSVLVEVV